MSKLTPCMDMNVKKGLLTQNEADALDKQYAKIIAADPSLDPMKARMMALQTLRATSKRKTHLGMMAAVIERRHLEDMASIRNGSGKLDPYTYLPNLLENHGGFRFKDVASVQKVIVADAQKELAELLDTYKDGWLVGRKSRETVEMKASMDDFAKELHDIDSGNQKAKDFAKATKKVLERLRQRFNAAGGDIKKLNFVAHGVPIAHDAEKIFNTPKAEWVKFVVDNLDRDRTRDWSVPGGIRMTDAEATEMAGRVYDNIATNGWITREVDEGTLAQGAMHSQHADPRTLHFDGHKGWKAYNDRFGMGDPYETTMQTVWTMARDISLMEVIGPNPTRMMKRLEAHTLKQYHTDRIAPTRASEFDDVGNSLSRIAQQFKTGTKAKSDALIAKYVAAQKKVDKLRLKVKHLAGPSKTEAAAIKKVETELHALEKDFEAMLPTDPMQRSVLQNELNDQFVELHKYAAIPEMKDRRLGTVNRKLEFSKKLYNTVSERVEEGVKPRMATWGANVRNVVTAASLGGAAISALSDHGFGILTRGFIGMPMFEHFTDFADQFKGANRLHAYESMLINDRAMHVFQQSDRMSLAESARTATGYMADRVIGVSGLAGSTQASKNAFGSGMMKHMAREAANDWSDMTPFTRNMLEFHGFTKKDWQKLRSMPKHDYNGAKWLRPNEVATKDRDLSERYLAMIFKERAYAVPEATAKTKTVTTGGHAAGTIWGEIARSGFLFQSFGISVLWMHTGRALYQAQSRGLGSGMGYMMSMIALTSAFGWLALNAKEVVKGKKPNLDLTDLRFNTRAMFQGGGFGLFGDHVQSWGENRYGQSPLTSALGPVFGRATRIGTAAQQLAFKGKTAPLAEQTLRLMPWANLWQTRMLTDRYILDSTRKLLDPEHQKVFKRRKEGMNSSTDDWFFGPGDAHE